MDTDLKLDALCKIAYEEVKSAVRFIYEFDLIDKSHTDLYMAAQECCYGLNESELRCLRNACEEILEDRRM